MVSVFRRKNSQQAHATDRTEAIVSVTLRGDARHADSLLEASNSITAERNGYVLVSRSREVGLRSGGDWRFWF